MIVKVLKIVLFWIIKNYINNVWVLMIIIVNVNDYLVYFILIWIIIKIVKVLLVKFIIKVIYIFV